MKNEMARSVHLRRFVAVLLCCVLAFHTALPVAHAAEPVTASLTIAAGAMALGGLSAAAIESTIGPQVAAIVGTTMQGLGTSVYIAEDSAMTKTKFIMSKIAVWCVQAKMAKEDFYKRVAQGITVAANGTIQLTHDASKLISQFISWVYAQGTDMVVPEVTTGTTSAEIGSFKFQPFPYGKTWSRINAVESPENPSTGVSYVMIRSYNGQADSASSIYAVNCTDGVLFFKSSNVRMSLNKYNSSGGVVSQSNISYGVSFNSSDAQFTFTNYGFNIPTLESPTYTISQMQNYIRNRTIDFVETPAYDEVFVGQESTWEENKDLLNPAIDGVTTITPDLINKLIDQLAEGQEATMDIADYLDSLVDAFDALKAQVAELTDVVTGLKKKVANPETIDVDVTVEPVNPNPLPVVDPVELTPGDTIEGFSFPLDEIFPFCIPFDVVAALELFDVPAEAPSLHVHWELPYNIVFDFDLDLSAYDDIAALLRVMETLLFAVGLAVATRSLYIRS